MILPVVVLRPEPGASATVARAGEMGLEAIAIPLFAVEPLAFASPDPDAFDAVLVTSANAARHGAGALATLSRLPFYAVGEATAQALRRAGLVPVVGGGTAARTLPLIAAQGHRRLLHLCGEDVRPVEAVALRIEPLVVYRAAELRQEAVLPRLHALPDALFLVHSPRAAQRLGTLMPRAERRRHHLVAISETAAMAGGDGWGLTRIAARPDDAAMLALARDLCQNGDEPSSGREGLS